MMCEKNKYDSEYSKGMKKIYDSNYSLIGEESLGDGMKAYRNNFYNLYQYYNEHANAIKKEVIEPAKKLMEDQNSIGKKIYNDIKRYEKDYKDAMSNLEKSKSKFLTFARTAELKKLDSELAKLSSIPLSDKESFHTKSTSALKEAKEAERQYISALNYTNLVRSAYIDGSKSVLYNFQLLEEELIDFSKNILRKFFILSNKKYKECLYETEQNYEQIEKINMQNDINTFIEMNQTFSVPPGQIEYVPYSIYLQSKPYEDFNYPADVIYNVIVTLQSLFEKTSEYVIF
jgi:hypothetical protein